MSSSAHYSVYMKKIRVKVEKIIVEVEPGTLGSVVVVLFLLVVVLWLL